MDGVDLVDGVDGVELVRAGGAVRCDCGPRGGGGDGVSLSWTVGLVRRVDEQGKE